MRILFRTVELRAMALRLLLTAGLALSGLPAAAQQQTLNLQNADIQVLIATVSEITGRNFVVDPAVAGQVTVISAEPLDEDALYQVFLAVLDVHGYTTVPGEEATRIVPLAIARQGAIARDNGGGDGVETRVVALSDVPATELVGVLSPLMSSNASITPHPASNSLVITDRSANVDRLLRVIQRVDRSSGGEVEAIALEHASAAELAATLNTLYPSASGATPTAFADARTNTLLLRGEDRRRIRLRALISHLDTPLAGSGDTQVIYLKYSDAEALVPVLENTVNPGGTVDGEAAPAGARIQAHPETNALVISGRPEVIRSLQGVVRQLDVRRAQVLVEAIIAEVSEDVVREFGIQWQALSSLDAEVDADGNVTSIDGGVVGGTNFGGRGQGINILDLATNPLSAGRGLNLGYVSGATSILGTDILQLSAVLRALSADSDSNVLSTPSVVTLDHAEAQILVGQEVPFLTGQFTNTGANQGSVNPFQTITRENVGLTLTVTPHINEGDAVVLEIEQVVSSLARSQLAVDLITNKRELNTTVLVPDNTILVLGGLITDDLTEAIEAVPGLSRIPLVGELFKYRNTSTTRRNLMIFIRPRILRDPALQAALTSERYNYLRARQLEVRREADGLTPPEDMPLLPELYDYLETGWEGDSLPPVVSDAPQ